MELDSDILPPWPEASACHISHLIFLLKDSASSCQVDSSAQLLPKEETSSQAPALGQAAIGKTVAPLKPYQDVLHSLVDRISDEAGSW